MNSYHTTPFSAHRDDAQSNKLNDAQSNKFNEMDHFDAVSFNAAGAMGVFHFGVSVYLKEHTSCEHFRQKLTFWGASAGSVCL